MALVTNNDAGAESSPYRDTPSLRSLLFKLLSGWGANNAAGAASSPYHGADLPPMSVGAGQAPTIYDNGGLPADMVQRGREKMQGQMNSPQRSSGTITPYVEPEYQAPAIGEGELDISPPPAAIAPRAARQPHRRGAPAYDAAAMDYLTAPLQEGPNANIDDDTRARAIAWALRQNQ